MRWLGFLFPFSVVPTGTLHLADGTPVTQGLQTLTMTNSSPTSASSAGGGSTTIVQYAQGPDGQFYIPGELYSMLFSHGPLAPNFWINKIQNYLHVL